MVLIVLVSVSTWQVVFVLWWLVVLVECPPPRVVDLVLVPVLYPTGPPGRAVTRLLRPNKATATNFIEACILKYGTIVMIFSN